MNNNKIQIRITEWPERGENAWAWAVDFVVWDKPTLSPFIGVGTGISPEDCFKQAKKAIKCYKKENQNG